MPVLRLKINPLALQFSSSWQLNMVKGVDLARLERGDTASLLGILSMLLSSPSKHISVSFVQYWQNNQLGFRIPSGPQGALKCHYAGKGAE